MVGVWGSGQKIVQPESLKGQAEGGDVHRDFERLQHIPGKPEAHETYSWESRRKPSALINEVSRDVEDKMSKQKLAVFLYTSSEQSKNEIEKTIPSLTASQRISLREKFSQRNTRFIHWKLWNPVICLCHRELGCATEHSSKREEKPHSLLDSQERKYMEWGYSNVFSLWLFCTQQLNTNIFFHSSKVPTAHR